MLVPELCDNSCLHWGPHQNAFILGTSVHIKQILRKSTFLVVPTLGADLYSLTRTRCCCCCCHCCCHPQHCKSPAFCFALVCCCMNLLLVFLLASSVRFLPRGTHSFVTFHDSFDRVAWWSLTEIRASALLARSLHAKRVLRTEPRESCHTSSI